MVCPAIGFPAFLLTMNCRGVRFGTQLLETYYGISSADVLYHIYATKFI
jgi:hypothetical protein